MKSAFITFVAIFAVIGLAPGSYGQNLVQNPSYESGDLTNWNTARFWIWCEGNPGCVLTQWVASNNPGVPNGPGSIPDGSWYGMHHYGGHNDGSKETLYQEITGLTPSTTYNIEVQGHNADLNATAELQIRWVDGNGAWDTTDPATVGTQIGSSVDDQPWTLVSGTIVPSGASIEIAAVRNPTSGGWNDAGTTSVDAWNLEESASIDDWALY